MPSKNNQLPSVMMLLLSALGILFSGLIAAGAFLAGSQAGVEDAGTAMLTAIGTLAVFIGLLIIPSLVFSIRQLRGKPSTTRFPALLRFASYALIGWAVLLAAGYFLDPFFGNPFVTAVLTSLCVAIPIWWLIEFSRRGLARPSLLKEWGALTVGLTAAPVVIMVIETLLLILVAVIVMILLGMQPGTLSKITDLSIALDSSQSGMEALENLLLELSSNPTIAAALFLVIGLAAPFTEEVFKPLSVWLIPRKMLRPVEGFQLGLISGGAFALLESASLVSQITAQDWIMAVLLRATTGMLHIGLSGLVGYGVALARCEKKWGNALLHLLGATALHGLWNSLAMINGYYTTPLTMANPTASLAGGVLSTVFMIAVFLAVGMITLRLSAQLRRQAAAESSTQDQIL
jgi:RsiW-degrading membrane proteinase PrsW (M82 family)